jgi:hypothetical protein
MILIHYGKRVFLKYFHYLFIVTARNNISKASGFGRFVEYKNSGQGSGICPQNLTLYYKNCICMNLLQRFAYSVGKGFLPYISIISSSLPDDIGSLKQVDHRGAVSTSVRPELTNMLTVFQVLT